MLEFIDRSLAINIGIFLLSALAIAISGSLMTAIADRLSEKTGLGQALMGALFLGFSTSLPGIVTSVTAAASGYPELAISNALGDIAAQTAFLGIADITYLEANLEYAAADAATLTQGTLLIVLLAIPLLTRAYPSVNIWGVHPASIALVATYIFGLRLVADAQNLPMWKPQQAEKTNVEELQATESDSPGLISLWLRFFLLALVLGIAGYGVEEAGVAIADSTSLSENAVGSLFTAISTSLPELVTTIAAVQRGAYTLAVSGVLGGNSFDVLVLALCDLVYPHGSIYPALTQDKVFVLALTILMTGILLLGLLRREEHGIGNIGFESFFVLLLYLGGFLLVFFSS
ncbi:sodium:calcium antiporter [Planktothrix sp. FACHB-1355]|uniref:Sodium:calcium antiporter n=1 Tax=Aerosakkonema funiforme FACHB-1375 TaxID=2949571 RepID=A0A926VLW7_9CYAN|nr:MULTISPECIES: sodium:calcium antiporter [Oscillatoriales]MBD2186340.1 sodium:calcium antiporter [Aerosakkonema funiforme FACHB-1375]MBD3561735.1 sodium:calcium antiporter [Planktothrix sp. FACHB-1355]